MLTLQMKPVNKALFPFTGVRFVVALNDCADDESTVKYLLTKDNDQLCYLDFVGTLLKNQGCASYDVS